MKHPMCRKGSEELIFEKAPQAYWFENVLYNEVEDNVNVYPIYLESDLENIFIYK